MRYRHTVELTILATLVAVFAPDQGASMSFAAATADEQEFAKYLLLGVESARLKVRRGIYRGTGRIRIKAPARGDLTGPWELFCAFDNDERVMRFDSSRPVQMELGDSATSDERRQGYRTVMHRTRMIATESALTSWSSSSGSVQIKRADDPAKVLESIARPLDIRTLGLVLMGDFEQKLPFDRMMQLLKPSEVVECRREGPAIAHIDWELGVEPRRFRRRIWIDSEKDFSPIRLESSNEQDGGWEEEPECTSEVSWKEIAGVYVPSAFVIKDVQKTGFSDEYEIALEWLSVNQPIEDRYFDVDNFKLPTGTDIVDYRFGEPVVVKTIGLTTPSEPVKSPEGTRTFIWLLVAANLGIVLLLAALFAVRRWRSAKRGPFAGDGK